MLNHARTLLLNRDGRQVHESADMAAEMVPSDYRPLVLPSWMVAIRAVLFGGQPDILTMNYRLRQYLTLLHVGPLSEYVTRLDSRISYWPWRDDQPFEQQGTTTVVQTSGTADHALFVVGDPVADEMNGWMRYEWDVAVGAHDDLRIEATAPRSIVTVSDYDVTAGLSSLAVLPGSSLQIRCQPSVGVSWHIESIGMPSRQLQTIVEQLEHLVAGDTGARLFASKAPQPSGTFRRLWEQKRSITDRLSGLLMSLVYRMEEVRTSGQGHI